MFKPTKDAYGNRIEVMTVFDAVKVDSESDVNLSDVLKNSVVDISVEVDIAEWIYSSGTGYAYYKDFEVPQMSSKDNPIYILVPTSSNTATDQELAAYNKIYEVETFDGKVRVYVTEIPAVPFTILFKGIPNRTFEV